MAPRYRYDRVGTSNQVPGLNTPDFGIPAEFTNSKDWLLPTDRTPLYLKQPGEGGVASWDRMILHQLRMISGCFERIPAVYRMEMGMVLYGWEVRYVHNPARLCSKVLL